MTIVTRNNATFAAALVLLLAAGAGAAVVQTVDARLEGPLTIGPDGVTVGGKAVKWDDVLFLVADPTVNVAPAPHAVRLTNGEIWAAEIRGLSEGKIELHSALLGGRKLDVKRVRALDFLPNLPPIRAEKKNVLYREGGAEPVPGAILWIDSDRMAVDSPLGALTLPRKNLRRYVFDNAKPARAGDVAVALVDGSVLQGRLSSAPDGRLEIEHAALGKLPVRPGALRSVLRQKPGSVSYLAEALAAGRVETFPVIGSDKAKQPEVVHGARGVLGADEKPGCFVKGVRVWPGTVLRHPLPARAGLFRATLGLVRGSRGAARVRVRLADRVLFDKELSPGASRPVAVSVELPARRQAGDSFSVEVEPGKHVRFPCGVVVGDPHWVLK